MLNKQEDAELALPGGFWRYILNPGFIMGVEGPDVPAEIINNLEVVYSPKSLHTAADELAAMHETVRALNETNIEGAWGDKPTIVLSADNEIAQLTGELELHKELVYLYLQEVNRFLFLVGITFTTSIPK
jgi:hypothetical protein